MFRKEILRENSGYFSVSFAKFLGPYFLIEHLRWLLPQQFGEKGKSLKSFHFIKDPEGNRHVESYLNE